MLIEVGHRQRLKGLLADHSSRSRKLFPQAFQQSQLIGVLVNRQPSFRAKVFSRSQQVIAFCMDGFARSVIGRPSHDQPLKPRLSP
jgi:hypothetical protein